MRLLISAVLLTGFVTAQAATLVGEGALFRPGDTTIIEYASGEQYEFLDLVLTTNMTKAEAQLQYEAYGYSVADEADVAELFAAFGFTYLPTQGYTSIITDATPEECNAFVAYLSPTYSSKTRGIYNNSIEQNSYSFLQIPRECTENSAYTWDKNGAQNSAENGITLVRRLPTPVEVDLDPWSPANLVNLTSNNSVALAVLGSSIAAGDDSDFDVYTIDSDSISVGLGGAPNIGIQPLYGDYDGDGNTDVAFLFKPQEAGIRCEDTDVELVGKTTGGDIFRGSSQIVTTNCSPVSASISLTSAEGDVRAYGGYDLSPCIGEYSGGFETVSLDFGPSVPNCDWLNGEDYTVRMDATATQPVLSASSLSVSNSLLNQRSANSPFWFLVWAWSSTEAVFSVSDVTELEARVTTTGLGDYLLDPVYLQGPNGFVAKWSAAETARFRVMPGDYTLVTSIRDTICDVCDKVSELSVQITTEFDRVVEVDVDPWSAENIVKPDSNDAIVVAVMGSRPATGDESYFDVYDIDPNTLKLGPGEAPDITISPLYDDYDSDSNVDAAFVFETQASGILCSDTDVTLVGETLEGIPFEGVGAIQTAECDAGGCHP